MVAILLSSLISLAIGVAVSYYFSSRKKLTCLVDFRTVLDPFGPNLPEEVKIVFSGKEISKLAEWKVALWNAGNQTILGSDIASSDPLRLIFHHHSVLKIGSIIVSRPSIITTATDNDGHTDNEVCLNFNYLDRNDGFGFTVYTCPEAGDEFPLDGSIEGSILGIPGGPDIILKRNLGDLSELLLDIFLILFSLVFGFLSILIAAHIATSLGLTNAIQQVNGDIVPNGIAVQWLVLVGLTLFALLCLMMIIASPFILLEDARRVPRFIRELFDLSDRFSIRRALRSFFGRLVGRR